MKKYEKYKKSGIEWVGSVPEHWNLTKFKHAINILNGYPFKSELFDNENGFPLLRIRDITTGNISTYYQGEFSQEYVIKKNDLLVGMDGDFNTRWWENKDALLNQRCCSIKSIEGITDLRFLYYIAPFDLKIINDLTYFTTVKHLSNGDLNNRVLVLPGIDEQIKIASYLDCQIAIIDQLISKKERLIEKLKEKRQAIINEAVTKGLDPNAKMKDSGIKWVGEIPEEWSIRNLETVAKEDRYSITGGPFGSDLKNEEYTEEGVRIIQLQNIGIGEFKDEYKIYTSEEKADALYSSNIFPGEIIIAKMADPVARACIIPSFHKRFLMASDGIRLVVDPDRSNVKYIEYAINARYFNYQAELNSTGTTRLRIGLTVLKKLKLILPGIDVQNRIAQYLELHQNNFVETTNKLLDQITKLKEYRQSLILEAVTGKIDVRDWEPKN